MVETVESAAEYSEMYTDAARAYNAGQVGVASQIYEDILEASNGQQSSAVLNLGKIFYEQNQMEQALGYYQRIDGIINLIPFKDRRLAELRAAYFIGKIKQVRYERSTRASEKRDLAIDAYRSLQYFIDLNPLPEEASYADLGEVKRDIQRIRSQYQ